MRRGTVWNSCAAQLLENLVTYRDKLPQTSKLGRSLREPVALDEKTDIREIAQTVAKFIELSLIEKADFFKSFETEKYFSPEYMKMCTNMAKASRYPHGHQSRKVIISAWSRFWIFKTAGKWKELHNELCCFYKL